MIRFNIYGIWDNTCKLMLVMCVFGIVFLFCAHAHGDLPPNTNFCIPKQYTIKYQCADGTDAAEPVTLAYGQTYTTPDAATICPGGYINWRIDGTGQYITSNTTLQYTHINDITLVAGLDTTIDGTKHRHYVIGMMWQSVFPWGSVFGTARCSKEPGEYTIPYSGPNAEPTDNRLEPGAKHCYCKMTTPDRIGAAYVYRGEHRDQDYCSSNCTRLCGAEVRQYADFRSAVFTATVQ
ncbi:MAG: hypothetical protein IJ560_00420 [Alphaproteobacteria bacterium]|nr:hypothetical protein [Alphaproteobacteria bacterium]